MKPLILAAFFLSAEPTAKFEAVDIHPSAKSVNPFPRTAPVHGRRYEVKNASMVDLIRIAYGVDADKVYGGPNWLEMDRFDVIGKVPAESTAEGHKLMLQAALEERFGLVIHKDTKPLPVYVLTVGKKPQLKEAAGTEEPGCKPESASAGSSEPGGVRLMMSTNNGPPITLDLGPGMTVQYHCRNMTMEAFVAGLRTMIGTSLSATPVTDETGLKGKWNFDLKYSMNLIGPMAGDAGGRISMFDAVEKQLGLKLEERQAPTPVIVVDRVNRNPSPNPPETATALPPIPPPTEFEVATIKLVQGGPGPGMSMSRFAMQPGGRLVSEHMPLAFLITRAFNTNNNEMIVGMPSFASDRYDMIAKVPGETQAGIIDNDLMAPPLLNLLKERFGLKYHTEEREVNAYSLTAAKPKMKKADPESRTFCKTPPAPPGAPPGSRFLTCQNVTMALFAERLQNITPELNWPVADATGLEGGWDLSLTFNMGRPMMMGMPGMMPPRSADGGTGGGAAPAASDPTGGITIFAAIEKQLGLRLEKEKRKTTVFVIDHMEQRPTEN